jgi:hypothetical protein
MEITARNRQYCHIQHFYPDRGLAEGTATPLVVTFSSARMPYGGSLFQGVFSVVWSQTPISLLHRLYYEDP